MNLQEIQQIIATEIKKAVEAKSINDSYRVADISAHTHNGVDSLIINFSNLENRTRYVIFRIVEAQTDTTIDTVVGGDFVIPFGGYITNVGATVDTAGTTNTTTIDVNKNASTILSTKITIDSTEKTSRTAAIPVVINPTLLTFIEGDIFTFDVDAVNATPAKGLTIFMNVVETTP